MTKSVTIQVSDTAAIKIQIWFESGRQAFRGQCAIVHFHALEGWDLDEPYSSEDFTFEEVWSCPIVTGPDLVSDLHKEFVRLLALIAAKSTTDFDRFLSLDGYKQLIDAYFMLMIREDRSRRQALSKDAYAPYGLIS